MTHWQDIHTTMELKDADHTKGNNAETTSDVERMDFPGGEGFTKRIRTEADEKRTAEKWMKRNVKKANDERQRNETGIEVILSDDVGINENGIPQQQRLQRSAKIQVEQDKRRGRRRTALGNVEAEELEYLSEAAEVVRILMGIQSTGNQAETSTRISGSNVKTVIVGEHEDETMSEETLLKEYKSKETMLKETISNETMSNEAMSNETMSNVTM